uniref:Uncharacterized protein n=1 Tax=Buteo japonicus TaxID=224669 RepID=A0A8B9ZCV4_9AVES
REHGLFLSLVSFSPDSLRAPFCDQSSRTMVQRRCSDIFQGCPFEPWHIDLFACWVWSVPHSPEGSDNPPEGSRDKGGRVLFAWNPECFTENANLKHAASLLTAVYINRTVFSCSLPLLIIAQNTPSKIHTHNNPL